MATSVEESEPQHAARNSEAQDSTSANYNTPHVSLINSTDLTTFLKYVHEICKKLAIYFGMETPVYV